MNTPSIQARIGTSLLLLQLLSLNNNAFSQEPTSLNEVIITTNRAPQKLSDIGKVVQVITAETLARSQGRTLPEVLNNVAGLTIGGNGTSLGEPKAIYLRGSSTANTLILMDGIPVNDASSVNSEYDISTVPIEIIARVEVIKGGNSTLYGSAAVAGIINIITKQGYGQTPNANIIATAGSYHTFKQVVSLSGQIKNNHIVFLASNLASEGFSSAMPKNGETTFDKDAFRQQALGVNIGREINKKLTLRGNFMVNTKYADLDYGAYADDNIGNANTLSHLGGLSAQLQISKGALKVFAHQNNIKRKSTNIHFTSQISHIEAVINYPVTNFANLTSGVSYNRFATQKDLLDANSDIKSIYTSLFFKTKCGFRTEIGSRYNIHSQYGSNFTYTINPFYLLANKHKVFVNWSSSYRSPSLFQLFDPQFGNLYLKPELSRSFETGLNISVLPQKLQLNFSYFDRQTNDAIGWQNGYQNADKSVAHGFEVELETKPHSLIRLNAFYTHVNGKEFKVNQNPNPLYRYPADSYGVNVGLICSPKINLHVNYKLVGTRIDKIWSDPNDIILPSYDLVDLYVQYQPKTTLTLFADIKNVFNKDYIDVVGYTTKGFNLNAGVKLEFR